MKKQMRRKLSVLLAIIMVLTMGIILKDTAFAADGDYCKGCIVCEETGKVDCSTCYGKGYTPCKIKWEKLPSNYCEDCNGAGLGICEDCGGSGECQYCVGSGSDCSICQGSGWCAPCDGRGFDESPCGNCSSHGYTGDAMIGGTYCTICGGDYEIDCTNCTKGKVDCPTCSGEGNVVLHKGEYTLVLDGGKTYASLDNGSTNDGEVSISGLEYKNSHWIMENFTLEADKGVAILAKDTETEIEIKGTNLITSGIGVSKPGVFGIKSDGIVTFSGNGVLELATGGALDSRALALICGKLSSTMGIIASPSSDGTGASNAGIFIYNSCFSFGEPYDIISTNPKYVKLMGAHIHTWSYTSNNGTLTATCTCDNSNDSCSYKGKTGTNRQVSLTLSADDEEYTGEEYDGTSISSSTAWKNAGLTVPTIKYVGRKTTSYAESETAPTAVGTYTAKISASTTNATVDFEIEKAILTVSGTTVADKTYDRTTTATVTTGILQGVIGSEAVTLLSATGVFEDKNVGDSKDVTVTYTLTGDDSGNYDVEAETLNANISPKEITVINTTVVDKRYDGTTTATVNVGDVSGIIVGDNVTVSAIGTFANSTVGNNKEVSVHYILSGVDAENYSISDCDTIGNIKAAPLFDDCLGGNITEDNYTEYVKGEVPTVDCYAKTQGYIFNGWFYRGIGFSFNELDGEPIDGTQYFAEWLNNGKTVTTYRLILDEMCNTDDLSKYGWEWDMDNKVLTLNNATIDCTGMNIDEDYCAVYSGNSFILNVTGDNTIISGKTFGDSNRSSGLASGEDLTIEGNGKLLVISGESEYASLGLETAGDLIVKSGVDLTVKARNASLVTNGINLQGDLEIENSATVNAYSKDSSEEYYAVWVKGNVNVNGTLNLYGACKIGTETKEAMYLESESGVLNISETGKITSDGVIKTDNENGFGNKTDKCYTVKNCVVNNTELQLVGMVIQHNMVAIRDTDITQTGAISALIGQKTVKPIKNKRMEITLTKYEVDVNGTNYETYGYLDSSDAAFNTPNKKGHIFVGWFKDEIYASAWNFVTDCVRSNNIKIYPGFVKNDIEVTSNIPGRVRDTNVVGVADAIVELYKGRNKLAATVTDSNGDFVFNNVAYGIYNIVVIKDDNKTTQIYKVPDEPAEIVMPNVNTILEANDTGAVVDGMLNVVADDADVVKLVLEDKEEDKADPIQKAITKIASDKKIEYLEATLLKNNSDIGNDNNAVITIIMPYDTSRKDIAVYRYHDDKAIKLTKVNSKMETPEDGNYNIDKENRLIYIYASKFSTYAVGYTNEENSNKESKTTTYTSVVTSKSKKKIKNNFEDVSKEVYYYEPVNWAVENNVTAGIDETHFGPKVITTRAQMVTFLWKLAGSPEPTIRECKFTDVVSGSYYEKAVLWAVENGITHGTTETTFSPKENVKRGQAVTLIHNYKGNKAANGKNKFSDVKENAYYYNSVIWAVENGITSGTTENTFSPNEDCTRAQVVTFLYNCSK